MGTRMFDSSIADRLRRLPTSAVTAYFYINLEADDDGVCQDAEIALAGTISSKKDIDLLVDKNFLIRHPEEPGRVIVTHWHVNNNIAKSRKRKTANEDFLELLELKGNVYKLKNPGPVQPKPEPGPEPAATKEPEKVLVNEEKNGKSSPAQAAWKEFAEWTRKYPQIKQDDADGRAAMTQYMRMYTQDPDYEKLIGLLRLAVKAEVKTGREGITLTEIVERVRGDTG